MLSVRSTSMPSSADASATEICSTRTTAHTAAPSSSPPFLPDGAVERPAVALDHGGAVPAPAQAAVEDVVGAEKVRGEEAARLAIDGEGIAGLHDFAVPQQNDLVGRGQRLVLVVGDQDRAQLEV